MSSVRMPMPEHSSVRTSPFSLANLLRIFEIICAIIIICLVCIKPYDETGLLEHLAPWKTGEEWTIFTAVWTLVFALYFLFFHVFHCSVGDSIAHKCHMFEWLIYLVTAIFWIIAAAIETWVTCYYRDTWYGIAPNTFHLTTRYNMRAAAAAFCFLELLLFLVSFFLAKKRAV